MRRRSTLTFAGISSGSRRRRSPMSGASEEDTDRMEISEQFGQCAVLILAFMLMSATVHASHQAQQAEEYKQGLEHYLNNSPNGVGKEANAAKSDAQLYRLLSVWEKQHHGFVWHTGIIQLGNIANLQLGSAPEFFPDDERFNTLDQQVRDVFADAVQTTVLDNFIRDVAAEAEMRVDEFDLLALHSGEERHSVDPVEVVIDNHVTKGNLRRLASQIRDDLTKDRQKLFRQQMALVDRIFQQRIQHALLTGLSSFETEPSASTENAPAKSKNTEANPIEELRNIVQKLTESFFVLPETIHAIRGK